MQYVTTTSQTLLLHYVAPANGLYMVLGQFQPGVNSTVQFGLFTQGAYFFVTEGSATVLANGSNTFTAGYWYAGMPLFGPFAQGAYVDISITWGTANALNECSVAIVRIL
jgi:hypothetical protein